MQQLEFLFELLERVPAALRHDLLDAACRVQPTLHHPKLAHDAITLSRLETLLKQSDGFTIIHGGPQHARLFLFNALGNSAREVNFGQKSVVGVQLQPVSGWVPVLGITTLSSHAENRQQFQRAWSKIKHAKDGTLIFLGQIWNHVSHLHPEILELATRCHVLVADDFPKPEDLARRVPKPVHTLTVAPAREQPEWIRVTVQVG